jgi:plasmid rolling circle replication initiator protein Rep
MEKEKEMKKRAAMQQQAHREKSRDLVQKFEKAEQIRNGHKAL